MSDISKTTAKDRILAAISGLITLWITVGVTLGIIRLWRVIPAGNDQGLKQSLAMSLIIVLGFGWGIPLMTLISNASAKAPTPLCRVYWRAQFATLGIGIAIFAAWYVAMKQLGR
ncbi:MAG: hypothetical protein Q8K78_06265 [Planctomycetaceae bacterium]|nr:hypothetical protein [Planctomycetaceae bacterium]